MLRALFLALSGARGLQRLALRHPVLRRAALRFVAGEHLPDALAVIRRLSATGLHVTLDSLGEGVTSAGKAEASAQAYLEILDALHREAVESHLSLKLTQVGLDLSDALAGALLRRILDRAGETFVRIDMESSRYTDRTLRLFEQLWADGYRNVGVVIQSYLRRSAADVVRLIALGARVRLVKGAYAEPASVAFPRKPDVDANFARLAVALLRRGTYPAIATHDERLIEEALRVVTSEGIPPDRFEFQMLYGVRRDLQARLRQQGYRVRVYVPFGEEWYPYFMRRLAERPANVMFVVRSLLHERRKREPSPLS
jgi:proline dehydrogenase